MINFIINDMDLSDKIMSYQLNSSAVSNGNGFTDVSGNQISAELGKNKSLKIKVGNLTESERKSLLEILDSGNATVTGTGAEGEFTVDNNYSFNYVKKPDVTWEADFSLNQFNAASGGDSL